MPAGSCAMWKLSGIEKFNVERFVDVSGGNT